MIVFCLTVALTVVQAQAADSNQPTIALPGSTKYFFKQLKNYFQSIFTFKPEDKLALNLKLAAEKLSETQALTKNQTADPKTTKLVTNSLQAYQKIMTKVQTGLDQIQQKGTTTLSSEVIKQQIDQREILNSLSQQSGLPLEQAKQLTETKNSVITNLIANLKRSPEQEDVIIAQKIELENASTTKSTAVESHFFPLAKKFIKDYGAKAKLALASGLISEEKIINSAEAGECVAEQAPEKTYRYYMEDLMNNYKNLSIDFYVSAAETITPFNMEQFKACLISGKYQAQVKSDYQKLLKNNQ